MNNIKIHFLGAANTVTGSKYVLETSELSIMIDCGVFQGIKELQDKNWEPLAFDPLKIDLILLTHGHLDHTGYLPRLVKDGFRGKIIGTAPTLAIAEIILLDSGKIQEQEAIQDHADAYSQNIAREAFYTILEAEATLNFFRATEENEWSDLSENIKVRFRYNGHILGACFIELDIFGKRFVFSGDIGREHDLLLYPPERPQKADYLFLESTYGDRVHPVECVSDRLCELIIETVNTRGTLIIPSFAVERLQTLMFILWKLYQEHRIPNIPIFVDSPMGNKVLEVFKSFSEWHKIPMKEFHAMKNRMNIITSYKQTWKAIDDPRPKVVIAGSGMLSGGRVLTYLEQVIHLPNTSILMVGYQAEGTRGRELLEGAKEIDLHGINFPVRAKIYHIDSLSAHADQVGLVNWTKEIGNIPQKVFLIHGEEDVLITLKAKLEKTYSWDIAIPKLNEVFKINI